MLVTGIVFSALAALLHVYIFWLESVAWTTPRARSTFGTTEEEAEITKPLAFNQGFYNLFLAIAAGVGIGVFLAGFLAIGLTLVFTGVGSMFAAALVLFVSSPDKRPAAIRQGTLPLLALIALGLGFFV